MDITVHGVVAILQGPPKQEVSSNGIPYAVRDIYLVTDEGATHRIIMFCSSGTGVTETKDPYRVACALWSKIRKAREMFGEYRVERLPEEVPA